MNQIISYCGLDCYGCPIYLATREPDQAKKEMMVYNIIQECKEHYGVDYKFEDINACDGCKTESGRLFFGCSDCKIRKCAVEKGIENCTYCYEYACYNLTEFFKADPGAKIRLDEIRNQKSEVGDQK